MARKGYIFSFLLILILLSGLGIRVYELGTHDLWLDEVTSIRLANRLTEDLRFDKNPPLYFLLLRFWMMLFGKSEFALRLLSVIFGAASIFMLYKIGKLLFDIRVGLFGAFILALSPIHIFYSQEARGCTLAVFAISLSVYFFISALKKDKAVLWILFILSSVISLYSSYYFVFIIPAQATVLFIREYRHLVKKWVMSGLLAFLMFLPWLSLFSVQMRDLKAGFWLPKPDPRSLIVSFENFNAGFNATQAVYFIAMLLFLFLSVRGTMYCYKNNRKAFIILASFLFLPITSVFIISQWMPIYLDRKLMAFSLFYYLIIACGMIEIKNNLTKGMAVACIFILSSLSLNNYFSGHMPSSLSHHFGVYIKRPFRPAVSYVKGRYREGDVVAHSNIDRTAAFSHYWDDESEHYYFSLGHRYFFVPSALDDYWSRIIERSIKEGDPGIVDLTKGIEQYNFKRIWLISSSWARDGTLDRNSKAVKKYLEKSYMPIDSKEFDNLFVTLYVPKR